MGNNSYNWIHSAQARCLQITGGISILCVSGPNMMSFNKEIKWFIIGSFINYRKSLCHSKIYVFNIQMKTDCNFKSKSPQFSD